MAKKKITLEEKLEEAIVSDAPYEVPDNWLWVKLNQGFAECLDKFRKPVNSTERSKRVGEVPYYGATGQVGFIDDYLTNENLVLVGEDGAPFFDILKDKAYIIDGKAWVNNHAHILKSHYGIIGNKYLVHYLNIFNYNKYVNGTTRLKLTQASMNNIPVPLPPLKEQQRIVDKIENLFEKLDKAKELIEAARNDFEKRKSAILEKAFRGKLTKEWRSENNTSNCYEVLISEIESRQEKYSKVKKKEKPNFMNYGEKDIIVDDTLPINWIRCPIGLICDCIVPGRDKPKSFTGDIPWITIPNITSDYINKSSTNLALSESEVQEVNAKIIPINSVIMSCVGRFGISSIVSENCVINQQLHAFLPCKLINSKFLMYHIRILKGYMESIATSTTIAYVNKSGCNSIPINLPPLEEQNEIVKILDKLLNDESRIEELTVLEEQIELIKKSILAKAFRGQLGTNCEDDESALELLKDILSDQ